MQVIPVTTSIWFVLKIFFIIGLSVYFIFALVIVRQVQIMIETVKLSFEIPIKILSVIHLILAVSLLLFAIISLPG